jgi:uncharacterized protein (TIGR02147 family)
MSGQFQAAKLRNPSFSLRAFSRKIGLSSSAVSEIFSGKRKVSRKLAERVLLTLQQDADVIQNVLSAFDEVAKSRQPAAVEYRAISIETYAVISEWYHFAILNLMETVDFESNAAWIAQRLGLDSSVVEGAVNRMAALGMLKWEDGKLKRVEKKLTTSDDIANAALKRAHKQNLQLAAGAIDDVALDKRDFTAMTFAINMNRIPQAKKIIRRFLDEISDCLEAGDATEVYKLSVGLFPLTKLEASGGQGE